MENKSYEEFSEEFKKSVLESNPQITLVISAHNYLEALLSELLCKELPNHSKFDKMNLRFNQKVSLCFSLELIEDSICKILIELNKLRNKFGHKLNYKITKQDIDNIIKLLSNAPESFFLLETKSEEDSLKYAVIAICSYMKGRFEEYPVINS